MKTTASSKGQIVLPAELRQQDRIEPSVFLIGQGHVLDILEHPNQQRYGGQRIVVVQRDDYVYLVPFVEDDKLIALKTIIPSRKASKQYLEKESDDHEA
jgi:bifunctional DNA-binding transcriptional regulator/antitoxin component of YhaV-PrlF toxin-antitoxin module